ncbi:origin recognition complex subunit 2 [Aricia agestis]|uniref:origin recognition complex subunit 2 n=1 Tax=Aricia agestis TaxID=91739 RepID=UPI001C2090BD|nr:origin recognition complex subunit 2 [Aricia agestis]
MDSDSETESFSRKVSGLPPAEKFREVEPLTPRRLARNRTKPKRYGEFLELSPVKRKMCVEVESSDEEVEGVDKQRPTALFGADDVDGQDIFKFKSRHTKHDLHNKVKEAIINSPTPQTTIKNIKINLKELATPKQVVNKFKKRIMQEVESDSAESDFSGSSSDFVPDKSDEESESSQSGSEEETEEQVVQNPTKLKTAAAVNRRGRQKDSEYFVTPDNYFMMNSSKKITTSDHTLSRLKNLNLDDNMQKIDMSSEHKLRISELVQTYEDLFDKWLYVLSEDFNIVLYGIGSKRTILQKFQNDRLQNYPCIVVNGFFPSLTMKNILEAIIIDLLENTHVPTTVGDIVNLIDTQLKENNVEVFLIIHNIDGPMLRSSKSQALLANISQIKNIHTIATIDHINAPLLWDHTKLSKFRFTWWDTSTFLPYVAETSYESALLSHRAAALQLSSLRSVHKSLTANAKGIFKVIAEYQLEHQKQAHYTGLPFKDLYSKAREQFLVSSDLALRAQLTEFLDHKLVKYKRTYDGGENLVIPIESALLQQFLEQQSI